MQEEKQSITEDSQERMTNSQVADSGGKNIFENHVLCSQLFHDYKGKMLEEIIDELEAEDEAEDIKAIIEIASKNAPGYDVNQIYEDLVKKRQPVEIK